MPLDLIFTKSSLFLSKKPKDWFQWQDLYEDYITSLSFENKEELLDYLQMDYGLSDTARSQLSAEIIQNASEIIELKLPRFDT